MSILSAYNRTERDGDRGVIAVEAVVESANQIVEDDALVGGEDGRGGVAASTGCRVVREEDEGTPSRRQAREQHVVGGVEVAQDDDGRGVGGLNLVRGRCGLGPVDVDGLRQVGCLCGERGLTWQRDGLDPHEDGDVVGGAVRRLLEDRRAEGVLRDEAVEVAVFQEDGIRRTRGTDEAR